MDAKPSIETTKGKLSKKQRETVNRLAEERIYLEIDHYSEKKSLGEVIMEFELENESIREFTETKRLEDELNAKQFGGTPLTDDDLDRLDLIHCKYRNRRESIRSNYAEKP